MNKEELWDALSGPGADEQDCVNCKFMRLDRVPSSPCIECMDEFKLGNRLYNYKWNGKKDYETI